MRGGRLFFQASLLLSCYLVRQQDTNTFSKYLRTFIINSVVVTDNVGYGSIILFGQELLKVQTMHLISLHPRTNAAEYAVYAVHSFEYVLLHASRLLHGGLTRWMDLSVDGDCRRWRLQCQVRALSGGAPGRIQSHQRR